MSAGSAFGGAFPDVHFCIEDDFADRHREAVWWVARGTYLGDFFGTLPLAAASGSTGSAVTASWTALLRWFTEPWRYRLAAE